MLDGLRVMSKNWLGRALLGAFAGLIIVGFGIFGIRDVFFGFRANRLAVVGDEEIGVAEYRNAYQTDLQRMQRQTRRPITNEEAHARGLDAQVLGRLIANSALDQTAAKLGLAMSDAQVASLIAKEPSFAGPNGAFDQNRFNEILRDNGYTERSFVREQRALALRQELTETVAGAVLAPNVLLAALNRYSKETRKADYFVLPAPDADAGPAPDEKAVAEFYELRSDAFRAPEYRKLTLLTLSPAALAKPDAVADAVAQKLYDKVKDERFGAPEKRAIEQLAFASDDDAAKASAKLKAGARFEDIAVDPQWRATRADLGVHAKSEIFDPAVAQAAFALPAGGVSEPIEGKFHPVILRVNKIEAASTKPFSDVAAQLKTQIAESNARNDAQSLHDKIEDLRANGKTLSEAAAALGLTAQTVEASDPTGLDKTGKPIAGLAGSPDLLKAIFASDVGVDNDAVSSRDGGYSWFEIGAVEPSHMRKLDEVRPEVEKRLKLEDAQRALAAKAADLVRQLQNGATLESLAKAQGDLAIKHAENVRRNGGAGLSNAAVAQIFGVAVDNAGAALGDNGSRIVFKVIEASVPPLDVKASDIVAAMPQIKQSIAEEMLSQYIIKAQDDLGVTINRAALRAATGADEQ